MQWEKGTVISAEVVREDFSEEVTSDYEKVSFQVLSAGEFSNLLSPILQVGETEVPRT